MKKLFLFLVFAGICLQTYAQHEVVYNGVLGTNDDVVAADVAIDPSTNVLPVGDKLVFTIKVNCTGNGNAAAWRIKGTILIPDEVDILSFSSPAPSHATLVWGNPGNTDNRVKTGYLVFEKESLNRNESFTMVIETSKPLKAKATSPNFGVFVHSQIPDFELCNNYWYWKEYAFCKDASIKKK